MKHVAFILVLVYALAVVWQPAVTIVAAAVDLPIALRSALLGFVCGLAFSLFVAYAWIYNRVVEADRRRGHERVDQEHDGRRI